MGQPHPATASLTELHVDELKYVLAGAVDVDELRVVLARAMRDGAVVEVDIVQDGYPARAVLKPSNARIVSVQAIPLAYHPGTLDPGKK